LLYAESLVDGLEDPPTPLLRAAGERWPRDPEGKFPAYDERITELQGLVPFPGDPRD
jgi:hypothetical protein